MAVPASRMAAKGARRVPSGRVPKGMKRVKLEDVSAAAAKGFSARDTLRRAGFTVRHREAPRAREQAAPFAQAFYRYSGMERAGIGAFLLFAGFSLLALALLDTALRGRGPAAVERLLALGGQGISRLVAANDPIVGHRAGEPGYQYVQPTAQTAGAAAAGRAEDTRNRPGRATGDLDIIGRPGQGTHTIGNWQSDNAYDVSVPVGTPVYAVAAGTIGSRFGALDSTDPRFAGLRLTLEAASNAFYYAHLSAFAPGIKPGVRVRKGQLLGYTGSANGVPHLHFAARARDPLAWLRSIFNPSGRR